MRNNNNSIMLRQGQGANNYFLCPSGDSASDITYVHALVSSLNIDSAIYGLSIPQVGEDYLGTIESIARMMVAAIRHTQELGPYRILGWSYGGTLAYEVAMQLLGEDLEIELIGLIDAEFTSPPLTAQIYNNGLHKGRSITTLDALRRLDAPPADPLDKGIMSAIGQKRLADRYAESAVLSERLKRFLLPELASSVIAELASRRAWGDYHVYPIHDTVHIFCTRSETEMGSHIRAWQANLLNSNVLYINPYQDPSVKANEFNMRRLGYKITEVLDRTLGTSPDLQKVTHYPLQPIDTGTPFGKAPLFCIPGAGADITSFFELAANLKVHRPVYGLQPRGLDTPSIPHSTVSAAATFYLNAIDESGYKGPFNLLGHSFGAWIAYEMARQLVEDGRVVGSLTLLDADPPEDRLSLLDCDSAKMALMWLDTIELTVGKPMGIKHTDVAGMSEPELVNLLHRCLVNNGLLPARSKPEILKYSVRVFSRAIRTPYSPQSVYHGAAKLIVADDPRVDKSNNNKRHRTNLEGWRLWIPHVILQHTEGNHISMLKGPHAKYLAQLMSI